VNLHDKGHCQTCSRDEYASFLVACWDETFSATNSLSEKYRFGDFRWDYATEEGILLFSQSGVTKVRAKTQVVGSTQDGSWEWSWANPNLPEIGKWRMSEIREFGEEKGWSRLTTPFLRWEGTLTSPIGETELVGWECSSIANHLLGGLGVYRAIHPGGVVWLVITECEYVGSTQPAKGFWSRVFSKIPQ
jgi:hypothetical protein